MLKNKPSLLLLLPMIVSLSLSGCSSSKLKNIGKLKKEVSFYYESGQYNQEVKEIVDKAIVTFSKMEFKDSSAVVFDIDETALSNYQYIKSVNFGYVPSLWEEWILTAKAPAIEEVKTLYNYLLGRGVHIIFLTARTHGQCEATQKNLITSGYIKFDTLICRSPNESSSSAADFKNIERIVLVGLGYKIIGCVGDLNSDFQGANTGLKILIPNYLYSDD